MDGLAFNVVHDRGIFEAKGGCMQKIVGVEEDCELDIPEGCEAVIEQHVRWRQGLMEGGVGHLETILTDDFRFTTFDTRFASGSMDKKGYIALNKAFDKVSIRWLGMTARRQGKMVTLLIFSEVNDSFSGDTGEGMPSDKELTDIMTGRKIAYGTGWRLADNGEWQCFNHHVFGFPD